MKAQKKDLERFAALVREYHDQLRFIESAAWSLAPERRMQETITQTYRATCDMLQDEIGEERMNAAREEHEECRFREAEAIEDRRIEEDYL